VLFVFGAENGGAIEVAAAGTEGVFQYFFVFGDEFFVGVPNGKDYPRTYGEQC